jgi:predicted glutamine amidotransferase
VAELFAREAREECSTTYIAHVRHASVGALTLENTHPFVMDGRIFGHNGIVGDVALIEAELGDVLSEVHGATDSERLFALITRHIRDAGGDVKAGIVSAARWLASNVELYSLNFVMATADELWALRYPEGNELWVLHRVPVDDEPLDEHGSHGEINVVMDGARETPVVVIASEKMDDDPRWREVHPGELIRVGPDLDFSVDLVLPDPPARLMELEGREAESQTASVG